MLSATVRSISLLGSGSVRELHAIVKVPIIQIKRSAVPAMVKPRRISCFFLLWEVRSLVEFGFVCQSLGERIKREVFIQFLVDVCALSLYILRLLVVL